MKAQIFVSRINQSRRFYGILAVILLCLGLFIVYQLWSSNEDLSDLETEDVSETSEVMIEQDYKANTSLTE